MRRLRMAMIGGGPGAFIGPVHRMAAELDGRIALAAGAFSSSADRSRAAGTQYGIDPDRSYGSVEEMLERERGRADGIEFVTIATPNHLHLAQAQAALRAGLPVISDKPATATLAEVQTLDATVAAAGLPYALTFTYTGYAMVREARARIAAGAIGAVRRVMVEYLQGWLAEPIERDGNRQAAWRADPALAGVGGCIGDIGVHAFNLLEFITGQPVACICADLTSVVAGRTLDDDCNVLLRLANGAPGVLTATQIATGARNGLRIRVHGQTGSIDWCQECPDRLTIEGADGQTRIVHAGGAGLGQDAQAACRLPPGHPQGFIEALATLYGEWAGWLLGDGPGLLPGIAAGLRSMAFVETAVTASRARHGWVDLPT